MFHALAFSLCFPSSGMAFWQPHDFHVRFICCKQCKQFCHFFLARVRARISLGILLNVLKGPQSSLLHVCWYANTLYALVCHPEEQQENIKSEKKRKKTCLCAFDIRSEIFPVLDTSSDLICVSSSASPLAWCMLGLNLKYLNQWGTSQEYANSRWLCVSLCACTLYAHL